MKKTEEREDEGARAFGPFLQHIDDGALHAEASSELHRLGATLHSYVHAHGGVAKGTITLTISLAALENGSVDVTGDVKVKEPKSKRARSVFWFTKGNNLSHENPRQQKLPLREVPSKGDKVRELDGDDRPARQV